MTSYNYNRNIYTKNNFGRNSFGHNKKFGNKVGRFYKSMDYKSSPSLFKNKKLILILIGCFILLPMIIWFGIFYFYILKDLPDLKQIETLTLAQTTTIADRNGDVLYKVFDENREYVSIDKISSNMHNAIVAAEDKSFWTNQWIDFVGIARAVWRDVSTEWSATQWWSTITQQLVKNLLLTNEKTLERKLKEIVLTLKLGELLQAQVAKANPWLSSKERNKKVKEKVLELYLNYIFLGNNSYGVEAASKGYFGKNASQLGILESSILASIPQAPWRYNLNTNKELVMGSLEVQDPEWQVVWPDFSGYPYIKEQIQNLLTQKKIWSYRKSDSMLTFLSKAIDMDVTIDNQTYHIKYTPWRKDYVLARMYEDEYITEDQLVEAFLEWFNYTFKKIRITIDSPHFVFWIIDLLKQDWNKYIGNYWEDILKKWGLIIKTTLDNNIQKMAIDSINSSMPGVRRYGWNNNALIHLDSRNGDILAYVGSSDYYNENIDWNVDVLQRPRQPWSTIKPLFYALGFIKAPLTLDTYIYDIRFKQWTYDPDNVDGKFMWPMPLKKALAHSRNIPAIKMYYVAGEDKGFVDFAQQMWVWSLDKKISYGPPMAIWSAEMKPIELANMYSHLSASGKPGELDPILEIRAADGTLIYKKQNARQKQVIPSWISYLLWKILSDPANLPSDRARKFSFPGIKFAHKTGTSNRRSGEKILPRDGWLATYTPSKVTIFWAWNTNGKPMHADAYGGWVNHQTWYTFWSKLKAQGYLNDEDMKPVEVKNITISKYSGKLASEQTPGSMRVNTMWYINNLPTDYDGAVRRIELDGLCMGKVSELTPASDIVTVYINEPQTFMPDKRDLKDIMKYTGQGFWLEVYDADGKRTDKQYNGEPTDECVERRFGTGSMSGGALDVMLSWNKWNISVSVSKPSDGDTVTNPVSIRYNIVWQENIKSVNIYVSSNVVASYNYNKSSVTDVKKIDFGKDASGPKQITVEAIWQDSISSKTININISSQNTNNQPPYILKDRTTIKMEDGKYKVTLYFGDKDGEVIWGRVSAGGSTLSDFEWSNVTVLVNDLALLKYTITDNNGKTTTDSLDLVSVSNNF